MKLTRELHGTDPLHKAIQLQHSIQSPKTRRLGSELPAHLLAALLVFITLALLEPFTYGTGAAISLI